MSGDPLHLSRRERQIMEILYRHGRASVQQVRDEMPDPPGYSAVRAMLRILEEKGHLRHTEQKGKYIYAPTRRREQAARSALRRVLVTFFDNSAEKAVAAMLDQADTDLTDEQLNRLARLIDQARKGD